jgi:ABC-type dipeptide/oligopeptide/nickel transport system ATPase subunit
VSLEKELLSEKYREKIIFISWEHHLAEKMVKEIMVNINKQVVTNIPNWENDDFDSIYVIKIKEYTDGKIANFIIEHQDLNNVKESCQF